MAPTIYRKPAPSYIELPSYITSPVDGQRSPHTQFQATSPPPEQQWKSYNRYNQLPLEEEEQRFDLKEAVQPPYPESVRQDSAAFNPAPLKRFTWGFILELVWKFLVVCCGFTFTVYACVVRLYDNRPLDEGFKNALLSAAKYGPTVYPIVFTAIVGSTIRAVLSWRLERGEKLGILNLLSGSTTLVGTASSIAKYQLPRLDLLSSLLIALWVLSPIGGQASLRMLALKNNTSEYSTEFTFHDVNQLGLWKAMETSERGTAILPINAVFTASLLRRKGSTAAPTDNWGNVRIPIMEELPLQDSESDDGWIPVSEHGSAPYSALLGIRTTAQADVLDTAHFTVNSSYWLLDCSTSDRMPDGMEGAGNFSGGWIGAASNVLGMELAARPRIMKPGEKWDPYGNSLGRDIYFSAKSFTNYKPIWTYAVCSMHNSYVEAKVSCEGVSCRVASMRRSQTEHPPDSWTPISNPGVFFSSFAANFVNVFAPRNSGSSSLLTGFFFSPEDLLSFFGDYGLITDIPSLLTVDPKDFSISLTQLLNTYFLAGSINNCVPQGFQYLQNGKTMCSTANHTTTGMLGKIEEVIVCQRPWFYVLLASSLIMVIVGLGGLIIPIFCNVPDIDLDISAIIRDSPYAPIEAAVKAVPAPKPGMGMVHHKNSRIRVGDAAAEQEMGHIAFGLMEYVQRVDRRTGRVYV